MAPQPRQIVVIGASAGGIEALTRLVRLLPPDFPAPILITLHLSPAATSVLPAILQRAGDLPASTPQDGDALRPGHIHVARPDCHMLVRDGEIALSHGPKENGHRPAVDPLFRTAADAYGAGTIGVVLSGALDDGAAGLALVKEHGGTAIVQDPEEATAPGMPEAARRRVKVDHVVRVREMAALLVELTSPEHRPSASPPPSRPLRPLAEADIAEGRSTGLTCPECGGGLWETREGEVHRLRCRVGHAYSDGAMLEAQGSTVEAALWAALRSLEERSSLLHRMEQRAQDAGHSRSAARFRHDAEDAERQAEIIRAGVLSDLPPAPPEDDAQEAPG